MSRTEPVIGQWYSRPGRNPFEVVAIDERNRTIELQYFDGTVDELDMESWRKAFIESIAPPEDYSGSMDMPSRDYEAKTDDKAAQEWGSHLDYLDQLEKPN